VLLDVYYGFDTEYVGLGDCPSSRRARNAGNSASIFGPAIRTCGPPHAGSRRRADLPGAHAGARDEAPSTLATAHRPPGHLPQPKTAIADIFIIIIIIDIFYRGLNSKNYCKDHCSGVGDDD